MKNEFKDTEIGKIPVDWEIVRIGDVAKTNINTINKNFSYEEIEYIDIAAVEQGFVKETKVLKCSEAPSRAKRIVKDNDILLSSVRPNLKHYTIIKKSKPNLIASTGFVVITAEKIVPEYLYRYITTEHYTTYLTAIAEGHTSAYPSFNPDIVENSYIPLPPLHEQQKIAQILSSLDDKIENNNQQNKILEETANSIFKEWFVNFNFLNEDGLPYFENGGEMKFNEELGIEIPKSWKVGTYSDLVNISSGKNLKRNEFAVDGIYPVIGANGEIGRTMEYIIEERVILTGRVGTLGQVAMSWDKVWISDNVLISTPKQKENYYYSYFVLKSYDMNSLNRGSTQPLVTQSDLKKQVAIIPNIGVLIKFYKIANEFYEKIYKNSKENQTLSNLRDSLLPKFMSGEIRLK